MKIVPTSFPGATAGMFAAGALMTLFTNSAQPGCSTPYFADKDGDLHGDPQDTVDGGATPPPGYVSDSSDCNDADPSIYAGAAEVPYDGVDQDCDGVDLTDADGDGVDGVEAGGADCDDRSADAYPGAVSQQGGLLMAYACNGSFVMGSPETEAGRESNELQHEVTLRHAFYVGTTEVTQGQFEAQLGYNPSGFQSCGSDCPVENVSWHEAAAFSNALSAAEGLPLCYTCTGAGSAVSCAAPSDPYQCLGYRLPTEAEWEYAARAGETAAFPNGGNLKSADVSSCAGDLPVYNSALELVGYLDDIAWYCGNDAPHGTKPVALLEPNAWGLYDVTGNVYEWCNDLFDEYSGDAVVDPVGATSGTTRVDRGPGYMDEPGYVRTAYRSEFSPANRTELLGFRVVRSLP